MESYYKSSLLKSAVDQAAVRWVFDEFVCLSRLKHVRNKTLINICMIIRLSDVKTRDRFEKIFQYQDIERDGACELVLSSDGHVS